MRYSRQIFQVYIDTVNIWLSKNNIDLQYCIEKRNSTLHLDYRTSQNKPDCIADTLGVGSPKQLKTILDAHFVKLIITL